MKKKNNGKKNSKPNKQNYLTLNSALNSWRKNKKDEFEKLEYGIEFISEIKNCFDEEEINILPIYEVEKELVEFFMMNKKKYGNEIMCFFEYIDILKERYKIKGFNYKWIVCKELLNYEF